MVSKVGMFMYVQYDSEREFLRRNSHNRSKICWWFFTCYMDETGQCVRKLHMNLLSSTLKQQLQSCAGSVERLKMWKIKPGIWFTIQVAMYVTIHGHLGLCLRCVVVGVSVVEGCLLAPSASAWAKNWQKLLKQFSKFLFFYEKVICIYVLYL